jgi:hypothetical protein
MSLMCLPRSAQIDQLFQIALQPIVDKIKEVRPKMLEHGVNVVYLVGGSSESEYWLGPEVRTALKGVTIRKTELDMR